MKLLFLGDGAWARMALEKISSSGELDIRGVILRAGRPDPALRGMAERLSVPVAVFDDINSPAASDFISSCGAELGVSMSYNQVIRKATRGLCRLGFINCHAGMLPLYRGMNIINWAILNGEKEIGVTVHFIDDGIDTGDIIAQKSVPVDDADDYGSVIEKAAPVCSELLFESLKAIASGSAARRVQSHLPGTYFSFRRAGDEYIDWNWPSRRIFDLIRAIARPGPGAFTFADGRKLIVWKASLIPGSIDYISAPGEIVGRSGEGVAVKTGDNSILLRAVGYEAGEPFVPRFPIGKRLGINLAQKVIELEEEVGRLKGIR